MNSLTQAKTLGGVGSILLLLFFVPFVGFILTFVGLILILIAIKYISDALKDKAIFENILISTILIIVGTVLFIILFFFTLFGTFFPIPFPASSPGFWMDVIPRFLINMLVMLLILLATYLVGTIFLRRGYNIIASKLNVKLFSTTALLYLIGAALTIVMVGFIVIFVALILQTIAFFSIPEKLPEAQSSR
ncbi:MAG: DUF996 domain-containing protein [Nitrososphaerales archaeon]